MRKTAQMRKVEARLGKPVEALIRERVEAGDNWDEMALALGITRTTLFNWTMRLGGEVSRTIRFRSEETARAAV